MQKVLTTKIQLLFLLGSAVFVFSAVARAASHPAVTISHNPKYPTSSNEVTFTATAADDTAVDFGPPSTFEVLVDENNDGNYNDFRGACATSPCAKTRGPYTAGKIISYYAIAKDTFANFGSSLPTKSFTIFDLAIAPTPKTSTADDTVVFTASATSDVGVREIAIFVDENPAAFGYEYSMVCAIVSAGGTSSCSTSSRGPYPQGRQINYYASTRDNTNDNNEAETTTASFTVAAGAVAAADFTAQVTDLTVTFTDTSTPSPGKTLASWLWDFGDGNTSTVQNPGAYIYASAENYNVTLTVTDSDGKTSTIIKPVSPTLPAGFTSDLPDVTVPYLAFIAPKPGYPINPDLTGTARTSYPIDPLTPSVGASGFPVFYEIRDTTSYDIGGAIASCKFFTKDGAGAWTERGDAACVVSQPNQTVFINGTWCTTEGTNACGVRIEVTDENIAQSPALTITAERFFTIDYSPPRIELSSNITDPSQRTDAQFEFWGTDEHGVKFFQCNLDTDGGGFINCTSPVNIVGVAQGFNTFTVKAFDYAGNENTTSITWEVDSIAPLPSDFGWGLGALGFPAVTSFSIGDLIWNAPQEVNASERGTTATQYDIRYSVWPIESETSWKDKTILITEEILPKSPDSGETMRIGPLDFDRNAPNLLFAHTPHYFAIKARDEFWNWSPFDYLRTPMSRYKRTERDPCDYDADRVYSPNASCGVNVCNPNNQICDLYDNPYNWELPALNPSGWDGATSDNIWSFSDYSWNGFVASGPGASWPFSKEEDDFWIKTFGATRKDLDLDGVDAANGRIGVKAQSKGPISGFPDPAGTDWYDNPLTADLAQLALRTNLPQLRDTVNDLDLDTFILQSWKDIYGSSESSEPDTAEFRLVNGNLEGGCQYPDALEATCLNCTAFDPEISTGRIPLQKTIATTNKNRAVCQIEAFYESLTDEDPPYALIQTGTINDDASPGETVVTSSAQCGDGVDNNLNGTLDYKRDPKDLTRERSCPTTFQEGISKMDAAASPAVAAQSVATAGIFDAEGIVKCGRYADDFKTPINESAPCEFKHIFYLFRDIMELILYPLMPLVVALSIVAGGFLMVISRGQTELFAKAKNLIKWAFIFYFGVLLSWVALSTFLAQLEVMKWTGIIPVRGNITALGVDYIEDNTMGWETDEWKKFVVEIWPQGGTQPVIRAIAGNTSNRLVLSGANPLTDFALNDKYHIVGTGWWSFIGEPSKEPLADFSASPQAGIAPFTVDFTDLSIGEIISWSWNFGDGGTSTEQSPSYTYNTNGPFTVTLTVTSSGGQSIKTDTIFYAPTANFTASVLHGRPPLVVNFTDTSTGQVIDWLWDFGELESDYLNTSTAQNPTHTYNTPGPHRVQFTATGPGGKSIESKLNYIFVYPPIPVPAANFNGKPLEGTMSVKFENLSLRSATPPKISPSDYINGWSWDLNGDAAEDSKVEHPKFFYKTRTSAYTASLVAQGPGGNSAAKTQTVALPRQTNFRAGVESDGDGINGVSGPEFSSGPVPLIIQFWDTSTGTVSGWNWDFDNNGTTDSTAQNPQYTYTTNGLYSVKLTTSGPEDGGINKLTKNEYIAATPRAEFSFSSAATTEEASDAQTKIQKTGFNKDCTLTTGCTVGKIGASVTFRNDSVCSGSCTWFWEFGDGGTDTVQTPTHNYADNEKYVVRLTATGPEGSHTREKGTGAGYIYIAPYANFDIPDFIGNTKVSPPVRFNIYEGDTNVDFANLADPEYVHVPDPPGPAGFESFGWGWLWKFGDGTGGDGNTSTDSNPASSGTIYDKDERYNVELTATGPGGTFRETKTEYVIFPPVAEFTRSTSENALCNANEYQSEETITFTSQGARNTHGEISSWDWDWRDGSTNTVAKALAADTDGVKTHSYANSSLSFNFTDFDVKLTANSLGGAHPTSDHIETQKISVFKTPQAACSASVAGFRDGSQGAGTRTWHGDGQGPFSVGCDEKETFTSTVTVEGCGGTDTSAACQVTVEGPPCPPPPAASVFEQFKRFQNSLKDFFRTRSL